MLRYKLKKDLPTFKAGDVFKMIDRVGLMRNDGVVAYTTKTIDKFPNILTDWFEEIKESTRWKPEEDQKYYFVSSSGIALHDSWTNSSDIDNGRFEIDNCFQTKEEAERVVEYLKALAVVRGDATSEFTKGKNNWYVRYDYSGNSLRKGCTFLRTWNGIFGLPYFATKEDAQRSIEQHKKEWLIIFGVEDKE